MRKSATILAVAAVLAAWLPARAAPAQGKSGEEKPQSKIGRPLTLEEVQKWTGRHPRLFFTAADVAALAARRNEEPFKEVFGTLLRRADRHLDIPAEEVGNAEYQARDQMSHILQRLAFAGLMTGQRKYGRKAVELMLALGERGFPFHGTAEDGAGDLLVGLALAYDWSYHMMATEERSAIRQQVKQLANALAVLLGPEGGAYGKMAYRPGAAGHHVVALCGGGLGMISLALRGETSRELTNSWQASGDHCVRSYLHDALLSDGAGVEGFDLTMYALHAALPYVIARRTMDHVDVAEGTALSSVPWWYVHEWLPGPTMLPLGESGLGLGCEDALAAMFAAVPGDPVHAWFYDHTHGSVGRKTFGMAEESLGSGDVATYLWYPGPPKALDLASKLPLGKRFPSSGTAYVRSGWSLPGGEVVASFHCPSRAHLGRWQMDVNQFTLYAYKAGWAIDSGCGWRVREGKALITPSAGSEGHNLMQVDGRHAARPFGRLLAFLDDKDWALSVGDGSAAFALTCFRRYLAVGKRDGLARYVVVVDEIDPGDYLEHEYVHYLHTASANKVDVAGKTVSMTAPDGATAQFAVLWPRDAKLSVAELETLTAGSHPRIEVRHKTAGKFYYVSVLVPRAAGDEPPVVITPVFDSEGAAAFRVKIEDVEDRVCILTAKGAVPPEGFGKQKHRFQFTNGAFEKSLLFDLEEPGHDVPSSSGAPPSP